MGPEALESRDRLRSFLAVYELVSVIGSVKAKALAMSYRALQSGGEARPFPVGKCLGDKNERVRFYRSR